MENINNGYKGSVRSKLYKSIWQSEIKTNPHLFKTITISYHKTRKEAIEKELKLQKQLNVIKNPLYINMSLACVNGYFGMDTSGVLNPNYGNKWSEEQKQKAKLKHQNFIKNNPNFYKNLNSRKNMKGNKNPAYGRNSTTYKDSNGNFIFTNKNDPRVISKELILAATNVKKTNETKSKNKNLKKYEYIILQKENYIIKLEWNEYNTFIKENKLENIISIKEKKGYKLIEAKLNPNFKMIIPIKKAKIR